MALRDATKRLAQEGKKKILLNLGGVKYMDSSGIGELIANYTTIKNKGGEVKLLNLTGKIKDLLVITGTAHRFRFLHSEADALK